AINAGLIPLAEVVALVRTRKTPALHVVLTGRGAPSELVDVADLVSENRSNTRFSAASKPSEGSSSERLDGGASRRRRPHRRERHVAPYGDEIRWAYASRSMRTAGRIAELTGQLRAAARVVKGTP